MTIATVYEAQSHHDMVNIGLDAQAISTKYWQTMQLIIIRGKVLNHVVRKRLWNQCGTAKMQQKLTIVALVQLLYKDSL